MTKQFDLLIFGATGFTGRFVVERLVKTIDRYKLNNIRWAVSARNVKQLNKYLVDIEQLTGIKFIDKINIYESDVKNEQSLHQIFSRTKLVINCVGPYSLLGEPVVKACLESDAHYVDICGEPLFLELMQLRYDHLAREKKLCAIGSCGFDSIPSDIGVQYLKQKISGRLNHVENFLQLYPADRKFNYATWRALIEGYKYRQKLRSIREKLFSQYKTFEWPVTLKRYNFYKNDKFGYCLPFPGSDRSVVKRSQMKRFTDYNELPIQCEVYYSIEESIKNLIKLFMMNSTLKILTGFNYGEKLLLKYSNIFSFGMFEKNISPKRNELNMNKFTITIVGYGWPNDHQNKFTNENLIELGQIKIDGGDLGYIDTAKIIIQTSLALLEKIDNNNEKNQNLQYGVLTPAMIFEPDELIQRFNNEQIKFQFISSK